MLYPILYKRASKGKIVIWYGVVEGSQYRSVSGQLDGKKSTAAWTDCIAKNIGKKNEISAEDQAVAEMNALYVKKRRTDYFDRIEDIDIEMRVNPMLAKKWADEEDKYGDDYEFGFEPKLDGFRNITKHDGMFTREGLPQVSSPHIIEELAPIFAQHPDLVLDGELYNHEYHDDFNKIASLLKKKNPTPASIAATRDKVEYWVYDMPSHEGTLRERRAALVALFSKHSFIKIKLTPQTLGTKADAIDHLINFMADGYEGAMGKPMDGTYQNTRSSNLLKIKKFLDKEYRIKDIVPGRGSRADIAAAAIMQREDGVEFNVGIIGSHDYCRDLLVNKANYIGDPGTVQFLNLTPAGIPRGGKLKAVRTYG